MPRYSTSTSIYTTLPGLLTSTANTTLIQQHADRVSGIVDGYVGRWYSVSGWTAASVTPQIVQHISDSITRQLTMQSLFTQDGQNKNEWVNTLADQAWKDLKAISGQELIILESDGSEADRASAGALVEATRENFTPIFDVDTDTSWAVDSDLTDSMSDDRA